MATCSASLSTRITAPSLARRTPTQQLQLSECICAPHAPLLLPSGLRDAALCRSAGSHAHLQSRKSAIERRRHLRAEAAESVGASPSASTIERATELVDRLLTMVIGSDRGASMSVEGRAQVLVTVEELEGISMREPLKSPLVFGEWDVAYTSSPTAAGGLYRSLIGRSLFRSKDLMQSISPPNGVGNLVEFDAFGCLPGSIRLKGTFEPLDAKWVKATFEPPLLSLGPLFFSYNGQSSVQLSVSYLDERVRLGRGSRGSVFVFVRRAESKAEAGTGTGTGSGSGLGSGSGSNSGLEKGHLDWVAVHVADEW